MLVMTKQNWNELYKLPKGVKADIVVNLEEADEKLYDVTFVDYKISRKDFKELRKKTKAYTVFYTDDVIVTPELESFFKSRKARLKKHSEIQRFFDNEIRYYYSEPYGEKFDNNNIVISPNFNGNVSWNGGYSIELSGDFGEEVSQVLYWKSRIPIFEKQCIEFYLEYEKDGDITISLEIAQYQSGYVGNRLKVHSFNEEQLKDIVYVENKFGNTQVFVSVMVKGKGKLTIKALHDRYSRRGHGFFLPGGERYVSPEGEELFAYFDPGDMKPPLNVYFSGYKTREGFEGYNLFKSMGAPFLLLAEARLEGGAFYFGDDEYEKMCADILKDKMSELGFKGKDVVMTGLSMGTTGAMYYAGDVKPHAVIMGKPLANIGSVAKNELTIRPGTFETSLDVLKKHTGDMSDECVEALDERVWKKIRLSDFSETIFAIAYMIEDDYDTFAYKNLIDNISSTGVVVYGKGIHGRHNDESSNVNAWFIERIKSILREDFKRDI